MNKIFLLLSFFLIGSINFSYGQWKTVLENRPDADTAQVVELKVDFEKLPAYVENPGRQVVSRQTVAPVFQVRNMDSDDYIVKKVGRYGLPQWTEWPNSIELRSQNDINSLWQSLTQKSEPNHTLVGVEESGVELRQDESHQTYTQSYAGYPIYDSPVKIHRLKDKILVNSTMFPEIEVDLSKLKVMAIEELTSRMTSVLGLKVYKDNGDMGLSTGLQSADLQWYYDEAGHIHLAYVVDYIKDLHHRYHVIADAETGEVLEKNNIVCHIHNDFHEISAHDKAVAKSQVSKTESSVSILANEIGLGTDLNGVTYNLPVWEEDGTYYLLDASEYMFDAENSDMPSSPRGAIISVDGRNKSFDDDDFGLYFFSSNTNTFNEPAGVSAQVNAILSYRYFLETFGFNSIDGSGGNIISIVDIRDEDNLEMDNAFWNGSSIYYGNGNTDFHSPLARSLDVGAHELTHGVIQSTANLRYVGESGALNESFADVFAVLIDRDDYTLGEDVVNTSLFKTQALRDLSDPNNGGSRLGDGGWQPKHVNEQYFGDLDEGGVHINSGIPNHAFYLIAENIGKEKAEKIYFEVLINYMTPRSDFKDLRISVLAEAEKQYGISSSEYNACVNAFDAVGIVVETDPGSETIVEVLTENPGISRMLAVGDAKTSMILADLSEGNVSPIQGIESVFSRPSITDDGSFAVYVDNSNRIKIMDVDWDNLTISIDFLESNPQTIWRNAVVSRDGRLIAITTQSVIDANIYILDRKTGEVKVVELYNPTTSSDFFTTDNVQYADAMEFDHSGEYLLYDAFNEVSGVFSIENATYWDIGLIQVFDRASDQLIEDGRVEKVFQNLDQDLSVGNPTFAKNHVNVIAFDYVDFENDEYYIGTANISTGLAQLIYKGNTIMYPTYTKDDRYILFNEIQSGSTTKLDVHGFRMSDDAMSQTVADFVLLEEHQWAVPFANGSRSLILTNNSDLPWGDADVAFELYPNPAIEYINLQSKLPSLEIQSVEIRDVQGRIVYQREWEVSVTNARLNLPSLSPGIYAVQIVDNKQVQYLKKLVFH
ncbi:M4 family metallopeptidase [Membranihabitans marinus]|uniref:M4 family metallopeptidase n=1 Tax=Membranihabitans marinus TaxID=1227546 RepID=UPI001EFFBD38|nr:M4 family metallopeptidase [Membranihabitans marinus]